MNTCKNKRFKKELIENKSYKNTPKTSNIKSD